MTLKSSRNLCDDPPTIKWHTEIATARAPNAPEVPPAEWQKYRELLRELYLEDKKTLGEVMNHMRTHHGFSPSYVYEAVFPPSMRSAGHSRGQISLILLFSKRQYTLQLRHWGYFKRNGRHRPQRPGEDGPAPHAIPHLAFSTFDTPSEHPEGEIVQEYTGEARSDCVAESQSQSATHVRVVDHHEKDTGLPMEDFPAHWSLSASITLPAVDVDIIDGTQEKTESPTGNAMLLEEVLDDLGPFSLRTAQGPVTSGLLSVIDEEDIATPSLSMASRVSTDGSTSIETANSPSAGNGVDDVHVLMTIDDEATPQLPIIHNEESGYENRIQNPLQAWEESAHTSKLSVASQSLDGSSDTRAKSAMPVFVQLAKSARSCLPSKLLLEMRPYRAKQNMTFEDVAQITRIADFFSAARSYDDAFVLYSLVFEHMMTRAEFRQSSAPLLRAAGNVTRTAASDLHYQKVAEMMRNVMSQRTDFRSPTTIEACLLHSHLGSNLRERKDLRAAENHCNLGRDRYRTLLLSPNYSGPQMILATNVMLVQQDKGNDTPDVQLLKDLNTTVPVGEYYEALRARIPTDNALSRLLCWCHDAIAENELKVLSTLIEGCSDELWADPASDDLAEFETTLLFCHLWKRWSRTTDEPEMSIHAHDCHALLSHLEKSMGIAPVDALSALSIMIMGCPDQTQIKQKSTLASRVLLLSQQMYTASRPSSFAAFLRAFAAPLRTKSKRFSSDEYATTVNNFVRDFADSHLRLYLSELAFQDLRLRPKASRVSLSPSFTPTMVSTPRSSWSGYASFKLTGRLVGSLHSRSSSAMNVDPDDIVMADAMEDYVINSDRLAPRS